MKHLALFATLFTSACVSEPALVDEVAQDIGSAPAYARASDGLSLDQLIQMARDGNPSLVAVRARGRVADVGVKQARGEYLPSLSVQTGIGGYTSQFTDDGFLINNALGNAIQQCESENQLREMVGLPPTNANCSAISLPPERISQIVRREEPTLDLGPEESAG